MIINLDSDDLSIIAFLLKQSWDRAAVAHREAREQSGYLLNSFANSEKRALDRLMRFQTAMNEARLDERNQAEIAAIRSKTAA